MTLTKIFTLWGNYGGVESKRTHEQNGVGVPQEDTQQNKSGQAKRIRFKMKLKQN